MRTIIFGVLALVCLVLFIVLSKRYKENKLRNFYLSQIGSLNKENYLSEHLRNITYYFYHTQSFKNTFRIDDITTSDLDLNTVFNLLDTSVSSIGQEYFYKSLRNSFLDTNKLQTRQKWANHFKDNQEKLVKSKLILNRITSESFKSSFYKDCCDLKNSKSESPLKHSIYLFFLIISVIFTIFIPEIGVYLLSATLIINIISYHKIKNTIYLNGFSNIIQGLVATNKLHKLNYELMDDYTSKIDNMNNKLNPIKKGTWIHENQLSESTFFIDAFFTITHLPIIKYFSMLDVLKNNFDELDTLYEIIGEIEIALIINNLQCSELKTSQPLFTSGKKMEVEGVIHPLINHCVPNSLIFDQSILITGSNASGKSTFVKSISISTICAQSLNTVFADNYEAGFFKVMTSMALKDNLFENESYFVVEIKSLNRILKESKEIPVLGVIDEILRGTNTIERIAASSAVLKQFAKENCLILAATHDIELTEILKNDYKNYHFSENMVNNTIDFDFKIKDGPSTSRNAIKLLEISGYDSFIIQKAEKMVKTFEETGQWLS